MDIADAFKAIKDDIQTGTREAVDAARRAAADVYVRAAKSAAPTRKGQLRESIGLIEGRSRGVVTDAAGSDHTYYVGPQKKTGYYGYFVEKGHRTTGARRVKRTAGGRAHSQRGVPPQRIVQAKPWFEPAVKSVEREAMEAAETAFYRVMGRV